MRGNLSGDGSWAFGYDAENQMRSAVSKGWNDAYAYDGDNRLRSAAVNGSQTNYMYDDDDLVAEYDGGFGLLRRFVPGPSTGSGGVDEPLVWYEGSSLSAKRWFTADNQGSIIAVTDGGGAAIGKYAYGRWGEPGAPITGTSFAYTGQRVLPGTDLYYYKARIYSPWLGRFMQTDPIGTADDLNLYAYVGNDPVNENDPSGECPNCFTGLVGGIGGAIVGGLVQAGSDIYRGRRSSFATYAGAIAGGAAGGAVLGLTGNPYLAGAASGAAGNLATTFASGQRVNYGSLARDTVVGAGVGRLAAFAPNLAVRGISVGRNSFNAIGRSINTKIGNGTIRGFSAQTIAKAVVGRSMNGAYRSATKSYLGFVNGILGQPRPAFNLGVTPYSSSAPRGK